MKSTHKAGIGNSGHDSVQVCKEDMGVSAGLEACPEPIILTEIEAGTVEDVVLNSDKGTFLTVHVSSPKTHLSINNIPPPGPSKPPDPFCEINSMVENGMEIRSTYGGSAEPRSEACNDGKTHETPLCSND